MSLNAQFSVLHLMYYHFSEKMHFMGNFLKRKTLNEAAAQKFVYRNGIKRANTGE